MSGNTSWRGFREVDIAITSAQHDRRRHGASVTQPATWRNNLVGLSQGFNLCFVAIRDQIHVYEPEYPTQRLSNSIFAWTVANSGVRRPAGILPGHPHWINRLVVAEFGNEEVIATAHDEGDFIVCTVRSILRAIAAARSPDVEDQDAADKHLVYVLRRNVEESAWGIAVHRNARLLAVSSNTKNVTIFAPALVPSANADGPLNGTMRDKDKVFVLRGHEANIPDITFCNTEDDPDGRFLVSTDINGCIIVWDIWKQCALKKIAVAIGQESAILLRESFLGWSVSCIDPRSFRSVATDLEFAGFPRYIGNGVASVDVTGARRHLRDFHNYQQAGRRHRLRVQWEQDVEINDLIRSEDESDDEILDELSAIYDQVTSHWVENAFEEHDDFEDDDHWEADEDTEGGQVIAPLLDAGEPGRRDEASPTPETIFERLLADTNIGNPVGAVNSNVPDMALVSLPESRDSSPRRSLANHGRDRAVSTHSPPLSPYSPTIKSSNVDFPFAILHTGMRIVTLLRPPFHRAAAVCIDPCYEELPPGLQTLNAFERLNLTAVIPELGVAILGTQKGRVAIFSLTMRLASPSSTGDRPLSPSSSLSARSSYGLRFLQGTRRASSGSYKAAQAPQHNVNKLGGAAGEDNAQGPLRPSYGFRLDWVVPFLSQEEAGQRPWVPLSGLATAPVQGSSVPYDRLQSPTNGGATLGKQTLPHSRRWRLLLMYADQSVLTYELFRDEERRQQLVVF